MPVKEIKSLHKAIDLLEVLAEWDGFSLAQLNKATGIPKATLLRILRTLEKRQLARRSLADDMYRTNLDIPRMQVSRTHRRKNSTELSLIAQAAAAEFGFLAERLPWPSDLFVRNGLNMELLESSRRYSPLVVNRNQIGDQVDIILSAVGRAYLAFCPKNEQNEVLGSLYTGGRFSSPLSIKRAQLLNDLKTVRLRGYGCREQRFVGATMRNKILSDQLQAIAVPVRVETKVVGCINMLWPKRTESIDRFADKHLADLQGAAEHIANCLGAVRRM